MNIGEEDETVSLLFPVNSDILKGFAFSVTIENNDDNMDIAESIKESVEAGEY